MTRTAMLAGMTATSIVATFVGWAIVIDRYGAGTESDALFAGMLVPQFVANAIGGGLVSAILPQLANERFADAVRRTRLHVLWVGTSFSILAALLALAAAWWVPWLVPGFEPARLALAIELSRIQVPALTFNVVGSVLWAAAQARRRPLLAESAPCVAALAYVAALPMVLSAWGVVGVAWLTVARPLLSCVLAGAPLLRGASGLPPQSRALLHATHRTMLPLIGAASYAQSGVLVDRFLLSFAPVGVLSLYQLALAVLTAGTTVLERALISPEVVRLAALHKRGRFRGFAVVYGRVLRLVLGLSFAAFVIVALVGRPLLELAGRWSVAFASGADDLFGLVLAFGGVLVAAPLCGAAGSALYAAGAARQLARTLVLGYTMGTVLKIALFSSFGAPGLALGTSAYYALTAGLLHGRVRRTAATRASWPR